MQTRWFHLQESTNHQPQPQTLSPDDLPVRGDAVSVLVALAPGLLCQWRLDPTA